MDINNIGVNSINNLGEASKSSTARPKDTEFQEELGDALLRDNPMNRSLLLNVSTTTKQQSNPELPEDLARIKKSLISFFEIKAKSNPKYNTRLNDLKKVFENYDDSIAILNFIKKNPDVNYMKEDLKITPANAKTFIALSKYVADDKIELPEFLNLMEKDNLVNNLDTEGFSEYLLQRYEQKGNFSVNNNSSVGPSELEFIAQMYSTGSEEDVERGKTLLSLKDKDPKFYNNFFISQVFPLKNEWQSIQDRGLLEPQQNGKPLYYDEIVCYSHLTDEEYKTVQDRDLFSLKDKYGDHFDIKIGGSAMGTVNNDVTKFARLTDEQWDIVQKYNLLENYNGTEIGDFLIPLAEQNLIEKAIERGLIPAEKSAKHIAPPYLEKLVSIENWDIVEKQELLDIYNDDLTNLREMALYNISTADKIAELSTIADDKQWQRFREQNLKQYIKSEDIIKLVNLDESKWNRFVEQKDTTFKDLNAGIGELAGLDDETLEKAKRDLFGKVDSADSVVKLLSLEPENYDYVVHSGFDKSEYPRALSSQAVDLIVNLQKYIGKESLDGMRRSEVRQLLSLLMENKQNIESSEFNYSLHKNALPIFGDGYGGVIKKVTDELGVYKEEFSPEIQSEYTDKIMNTDLVGLSKLAPEFNFIEQNIPELTQILAKIVENPRFQTLSDADKKVLLTAAIFEKSSTESLEDASFESSILTRRLGFKSSDTQKIQRIIENSNAIGDFMKQNREMVEITTPAGQKLSLDARKLQFDKIAFGLKEGNTFELAQMLYSTKEQDGLSRNLDKKIQARINEIKSDDFVLPQFDIRSWVAEMSKDKQWLEKHTFDGMLLIQRSELPDDFTMFAHCIDYAAATGGSKTTNASNFDIFAIPNDKVVCSSYLSKDNGGTFGGVGLLLSTPNANQMVGAGYDLYSFSKNLDSLIMEYYNENGIIADHGQVLKSEQRKSISNEIKGILYGRDNINKPENQADYIRRIDKLKAQDKSVSLADIKRIDEVLYNVYTEYFSRPAITRYPKDTLLRDDYHNEVLINTPKVEAYMTKYTDFFGKEHFSQSFFEQFPQEMRERAKKEGIPIIMWD